MAQLRFAQEAGRDLERLTDFLLETNVAVAIDTADLIIDAVAVLKRHPLIGRPVDDGYRELIISRGRSGYVAVYTYDEASDIVLILAIRHQRESGYWAQI
ncbi:MAG: type II toxin-antitoxin system RelE/ParE family toxin [Burkholderiaceae bacterium]